MNVITWKIGGEAGFGIMVSGSTFSKTLSRAGYSTVEINEYPSLIRGGHNTVAVSFSGKRIYAPIRSVHVLVALNKQTVDFHADELVSGARILLDDDGYTLPDALQQKHVTLYSVPFLRLAQEVGGNMLMRNTVSLGASIALLGIPFSFLASVLRDEFSRKGDAVVAINVRAAQAGYDYVSAKHPSVDDLRLPSEMKEKQIVVTGSEAVALGALAGGMKFAAIYPMTPINGILTFLSSVQKRMRIVYKQPEDEISGITMAIGASFAGVRAMVATSGGGLALMTEGISLAGMLEEPLVIVLGMRPGPATGLPTWTGQADLHFVLHIGHGEFPRIVLAAGDAEEAFRLTAEAFNLAETYQTPTFVLVDKYLCESRFSVPVFSSSSFRMTRGKLVSEEEQASHPDFPRYRFTPDGISPRGIPGRKSGVFRVNSDEHNEHGYSEESAENTKRMIDKRMQKQTEAEAHVPDPVVFGNENADVTLVGWGSTKGAIRDALRDLDSDRVNFLHLPYINPFPTAAVARILGKAKKILAIEGNKTGQMADYIRMKTGIHISDRILKYDGRPFYPDEILSEVRSRI